MRRRWTVAGCVLFTASAAWAQEPPSPKGTDHQHLDPGEAIRLLHETQTLMERSEGILNDSSRGKAAQTEAMILARIENLLKEDPSAAQKAILEKIAKLMEKSEATQKDAIQRMEKILKDAKS